MSKNDEAFILEISAIKLKFIKLYDKFLSFTTFLCISNCFFGCYKEIVPNNVRAKFGKSRPWCIVRIKPKQSDLEFRLAKLLTIMINIQLCGRATAVNCKEEHRRNHHNFQLILQSHHDASISSIHITLSLSCLVRN